MQRKLEERTLFFFALALLALASFCGNEAVLITARMHGKP